MSSIATTLEIPAAQKRGRARQTWDTAVIAVGRGRTLDPAAVADLAAAMDTLGLTADQFDTEAGLVRTYLARRAEAEALPTPAEQEADYRAKMALLDTKRAALAEVVKAEQAEIDALYNAVRIHGHAAAKVREAFAATVDPVRHLLKLMDVTK